VLGLLRIRLNNCMSSDDSRKCELLGGIFSSFIQASLGMLCVAILWFES